MKTLTRWLQKCSAKDHEAMALLLLAERGNPPHTGWAPDRYISQYGALKSMLESEFFTHRMLHIFAFGRYLPHEYLEPAEKIRASQIAAKLFKGIGSAQDLANLAWPKLLAKIILHPRFARAFLESRPETSLDQIRANMAHMDNQYQRRLDGRVEAYTGALIRGYVVDLDDRACSLTLDFKVNGHYAGSRRADGFRGDLQERFGGHGCFAFEHFLTLPARLTTAHSLSLEISDAKTGTPIGPARLIAIDHADFAGSVRQIADHLKLATVLLAESARRKLLDSASLAPLQKTLGWLASEMPRLDQHGALALSDFSLYAALVDWLGPQALLTKEPLLTAEEKVFFHIILAKDSSPEARQKTEASLKAQSYNLFSPQSPLYKIEQAAALNAEIDPKSWYIFLKPGDILHPLALAALAEKANQKDQPLLITSDYDWQKSDMLDAFERPMFLGPFDYDLCLARYPHARAFAISGAALKACLLGKSPPGNAAGEKEILINGEAINSGALGLDLILKLVEQAGEHKIAHIPERLWHLRSDNLASLDSVGRLLQEQQKRSQLQHILQAHFKRRQQDVTITNNRSRFHDSPSSFAMSWPVPEQNAGLLSVIIPTRDGLDMLKPCLESLRATARAPEKLDIIIIDNQSNQSETLAYFADITAKAQARVISYDAPFNWSAMNDLGAEAAKGDLFLFLNNDTRALDQDWDHIIRGLLARQDVGALGARLLYSDGTVQHGGVVLYGHGVAIHEAVGDSAQDGLYEERSKITHQNSAVTGAFLACRRDVFFQINGFDVDHLGVTFNDIDFCLKLREQGYKILYCPQITFEHLESKSRGHDSLTDERRARAEREAAFMRKKWGHLLNSDPFYPKAFLREGKPFSLLARPKGQIFGLKPIDTEPV